MSYFIHLFMLFLIYSVIGFILETLSIFIKFKKLVKRGFLFGFYLPIYGFGGLIIYYTDILSSSLIIKIIVLTILFSILEYFTSYILEKQFNLRWWDYSKNKFNINGRICLYNMSKFVVLGTISLFLNKYFLEFINIIPYKLCLAFLLLFSFDVVISLVILFTVKVKKEKNKDNTQKIHKIILDLLFNK